MSGRRAEAPTHCWWALRPAQWCQAVGQGRLGGPRDPAPGALGVVCRARLHRGGDGRDGRGGGGSRSRAFEEPDPWEKPLASLASRVAALTKTITQLKQQLTEAQQQWVASAVETVTVTEPPRPARRYLQGDLGKFHRESSHQADIPPYYWTAGCGWEFGRSSNWKWATAAEVGRPGADPCRGGCDMSEVQPERPAAAP